MGQCVSEIKSRSVFTFSGSYFSSRVSLMEFYYFYALGLNNLADRLGFIGKFKPESRSRSRFLGIFFFYAKRSLELHGHCNSVLRMSRETWQAICKNAFGFTVTRRQTCEKSSIFPQRFCELVRSESLQIKKMTLSETLARISSFVASSFSFAKS